MGGGVRGVVNKRLSRGFCVLVPCHVVAPLVLLNGPGALGALFGVGKDPSHVLRLGTVLKVPPVRRRDTQERRNTT